MIPLINCSAINFDLVYSTVATRPHDVFCCLTCGSYFEGPGPSSRAAKHSMTSSHGLFIQLMTGCICQLPENTLVIDPSLEYLRRACRPDYCSPYDVLEKAVRYQRHNSLVTGYAPLVNLGHTDGLNSVIQLFLHVPALVRLCLADSSAHSFVELCRKLWNPYALHPTISPVRFLMDSWLKTQKFGPDLPTRPLLPHFVMWLMSAGLPSCEMFKGNVIKDKKPHPMTCLKIEVPDRTITEGTRDLDGAESLPSIPLSNLLAPYTLAEPPQYLVIVLDRGETKKQRRCRTVVDPGEGSAFFDGRYRLLGASFFDEVVDVDQKTRTPGERFESKAILRCHYDEDEWVEVGLSCRRVAGNVLSKAVIDVMIWAVN